MRYKTIDDLPVHCQLNLPEPALYVYKDAWNRAWETSRDFTQARSRAWEEVRRTFERDSMTGQWVRRN
jgi:cation transport regulator ChaB